MNILGRFSQRGMVCLSGVNTQLCIPVESVRFSGVSDVQTLKVAPPTACVGSHWFHILTGLWSLLCECMLATPEERPGFSHVTRRLGEVQAAGDTSRMDWLAKSF